MDLKEMYMLRAEDLAWERHGKDFYDLTDDEQYQIYTEAEEDVISGCCDEADNLRKQAKEEQ